MGQHKNDLLNVKPMWNQTAGDYHEFISAHDSYAKQIEWPAIEALTATLDFQRVLDLGCGSGYYALELARRGAQVTGLDISAEMLAIARAEAETAGLMLELREGDIREPLQFDDGSFDLVFCGTALHYVERLTELFPEIHRVLGAGGNLLISALHPTSTALFPTIEQDYRDERAWNLKYFDSTRRRIFAPWSQAEPGAADAPQAIVCCHHTLEDYLSAIITAGFALRAVREPRPTAAMAAENPSRFAYSNSQPLFLIVHAERQ